MLRTLLKARAPQTAAIRFASTATPSATTTTASATAAISTPTLRKLESRWEKMAEDDKDEIMNMLVERQKADWRELTPLEKKAAWYISYGEWGPRRPVHAKGDTQRIFIGTMLGVVAAFGAFALIRAFMPEKNKSMSKEWQQATNEQLEEINAEPFTGFNQIQSPLRGISADEGDEDDDE